MKKACFPFIFLFFIVFFNIGRCQANSGDHPTVIMHDTTASPGDLLLQIDAFNFTGDNGQIAAITLRIDMDTNLVNFRGITNTSIPGIWAGNYNMQEEEITIIYNAPNNMGFDIDGKLLDLQLTYMGGYDTDLIFKSNCEFANKDLITIQNVEYIDGTIEQTSPQGKVYMDTITSHAIQNIEMPVLIQGPGYDSVDSLHLFIRYDTALLSYNGFESVALTDPDVINNDDLITINWQDTMNPFNFTVADTLLKLQFTLEEDSTSLLEFRPGSIVFNNKTPVSSEFINGFIRIEHELDLTVNPAGSGTATGEGYYLEGEEVTLTAIPDSGYTFLNWSLGDSILSTDSLFVYTMPDSSVNILANFTLRNYFLALFAEPDSGGVALGEGYFFAGDTVTVTAIPVTGHEFTKWTRHGNVVSTNPEYTFVMPASNDTLTAHFVLAQYVITAVPNYLDFGMVSGGGTFYYGDTATLIAVPLEGYRFVVWTEEGTPVSYDSIYSFMVESDRHLVGNFQSIYGCTEPIALNASEITLNSALLNWVPTGADTEWELLWGDDGFDTTSQGTLVSGIPEPQYLLEGLEDGSWYDFYVKAVCGDTAKSEWAGPGRFSTLYVGIENNYHQNVNIFPVPAKDYFIIEFPSVKNPVTKIHIYDFTGDKIITLEHFNNQSLMVNTGSFRPGYYTVLIEFEDYLYRRKIVIL